ncbi:hypothetical protein BYT27DRAFT_7217271 [Phlegmacium glaucopus]|nr:hypothetical protein BYT27DRAFT_7217271 [Phlegmacium glaucopus]
MSVAQLERAATAPLRWIALSSSKDRNNDEVLPPRGTRVIENPLGSMWRTLQLSILWTWNTSIDLYLVPGGRYLVTSGLHCLGLWDLGPVLDGDKSDDGKPTMWATEIDNVVGFRVHPTPDGLGIRILTYTPLLAGVIALYIFEIYPQDETPELAKIAKLLLRLSGHGTTYSLNGNTVVIYSPLEGTVILWDFIVNTAASWSISNPSFNDEVTQ